MRASDIDIGLVVETNMAVQGRPAEAMVVHQKHLVHRRPFARGVVVERVLGHDTWAWAVRHSGISEPQVYFHYEFDPIPNPGELTTKDLYPESWISRLPESHQYELKSPRSGDGFFAYDLSYVFADHDYPPSARFLVVTPGDAYFLGCTPERY